MVNLSLDETRVIGCLLEKERTTPDQYPLTLNALTQACNQKPNRDPVLLLNEEQVQETLDSLMKKGFLSEVVFGSRVKKYKQRFGNSEFSEYTFTNRELSLLCVLFLRGPQTAGELRIRTQRLCDFSDVEQVESCLEELNKRKPNAYVARLEREPGKRESRFVHLFSGTGAIASSNKKPLEESQNLPAVKDQTEHAKELLGANTSQLEEKIAHLESRVDELQSEIQQLKKLWS